MRFRITLFIFLIIYIFSGVFLGYFQSTDDSISFKDIQEKILIDENELNVFDKKSLEDINVTEKRVKAWLILINYNESNELSIKSILDKSGYKTNHNKNKMYFSLGPFADVSHANNEAKKLKKIYSIDSKVIDFLF
tara:strand:- start:976 stop:1383 length:408 start_codon:yes stop_codon:yes gene_type:complete